MISEHHQTLNMFVSANILIVMRIICLSEYVMGIKLRLALVDIRSVHRGMARRIASEIFSLIISILPLRYSKTANERYGQVNDTTVCQSKTKSSQFWPWRLNTLVQTRVRCDSLIRDATENSSSQRASDNIMNGLRTNLLSASKRMRAHHFLESK